MRILYFPGKYPFCYYYRGYLPAIYSGQKSVSSFLRSDKLDFKKITEDAKEVDCIVFQRPQFEATLGVIRLLKSQGKKIIFENDDTYLVNVGIMLDRLENDKQRAIAQELSDMTNKILAECDGAIASTPFLAEEFKKINPNVAVLKNCIDPMDEFKCKENKTGKFRIGFIGSVTTNDDYIHIKDQIKQLDDRGDITIVVFGIHYKDGSSLSFMKDDKNFWSSLKNVEWQSYVPINEYMYTLSKLALDLIIIPREESYFNKCKSNLKFLEASLLSIPVVAQSFEDSPYTQDKGYLTLVENNSEWYTTIISIKDDYKKHKDVAKQAHDYVIENYNIKTFAPEWTKTIEKLCKSHQIY